MTVAHDDPIGEVGHTLTITVQAAIAAATQIAQVRQQLRTHRARAVTANAAQHTRLTEQRAAALDHIRSIRDELHHTTAPATEPVPAAVEVGDPGVENPEPNPVAGPAEPGVVELEPGGSVVGERWATVIETHADTDVADRCRTSAVWAALVEDLDRLDTTGVDVTETLTAVIGDRSLDGVRSPAAVLRYRITTATTGEPITPDVGRVPEAGRGAGGPIPVSARQHSSTAGLDTSAPVTPPADRVNTPERL